MKTGRSLEFVFKRTNLESSAFEGLPGINDDPIASPQMPLEFPGDMKLTARQKEAIAKGEDVGAVGGDKAFSISNRATHRWPNAIIPYNIDCSLENIPSAISAIKAAMAEWESKTCLRFVQHTNEKDYLTFFRNTHCWGHVGRIGGVKSAFRKVQESYSLGEPYDYASIMHYPWTAFTKNGKATMRPRQHVPIQPYQYVSAGDAKQVSLMYNCSAKPNRMRRALGDCDDKHQHCPDYAKAGYCSTSQWVRENCELSCKAPQCDTSIPCVDQRSECPDWADWGHCTLNPTVMKLCPKSCHPRCKNVQPPTPPPVTNPPITDAPTAPASTLPPYTGPTTVGPTAGPLPTTKSGGVKLGIGRLCKDRHSKCAYWAGIGECKRNPGYMLRNCQISCNQTQYCDKGIVRPPGSCANPLGIATDGKSYNIPDSSMRASSNSELSPGGGWVAAARNARLYFEDDYDNKRIAAWCVKTWDDFRAGQYLEIDLLNQKNIQYIATQGRQKYFERVSKFKVKYSNDRRTWYDYSENGKVKEFDGNCDHFTPILNKFNNMITARYFRYYPTDANYPCVRMELYGC
eukprot:gene6292-7014_t